MLKTGVVAGVKECDTKRKCTEEVEGLDRGDLEVSRVSSLVDMT